MDTILASIRRILNEDEVAPAEAPPPAPRREPKEDVLVLGDAMMVPPERVEPPPPPPPPPLPSPGPPVAAAAPPVQDKVALEGLVAARTRAAAAQSFDALHEALKRDQEPAVPTSPPILRAGGPSLEDLVRDELRELLSTWLDVHLPGLVEALVRSEIEKLTRRG